MSMHDKEKELLHAYFTASNDVQTAIHKAHMAYRAYYNAINAPEPKAQPKSAQWDAPDINTWHVRRFESGVQVHRYCPWYVLLGDEYGGTYQRLEDALKHCQLARSKTILTTKKRYQ